MKRQDILQHQILRLAKIYRSRPIAVESLPWHHRVLAIQVAAIKEKKALKK
jgi:hypothetical protein